MSPAAERPDVKYVSRHCPFFHRDVWAVLMRQPDRRWKIVNCLDKNKVCFEQNCALTTDGGEWPFVDVWMTDMPNGTPQEPGHA